MFVDLSSAGLYPEIHSSNVCIEYDSVAQPVAQWYAWVTERALPMDQFLKRRDVLPNVSVVGIIRCTLHAAMCGHYLSDNNMFNFGVLRNEVVIIDAGSRKLEQRQITKGEFNKLCMRNLWTKLNLHVAHSDYAEYETAWQHAHTLVEARNIFDTFWAADCNLISNEGGSAEQPALPAVITRVPNVASLLEDVTDQSLEWILACPQNPLQCSCLISATCK